jgi:hypothetical protein
MVMTAFNGICEISIFYASEYKKSDVVIGKI